MTQSSTRFQSATSFIFATAASAVGLGNIWRFPYLAGENGGGWFVLIYLLFVVLLGIPLLMTEMSLGRLGRGDPAKTMADVAVKTHRSINWRFLGGWVVCASFLILTFYCVVSGWVLDYFIHALPFNFGGMSKEASAAFFHSVTESPSQMLLMTSIVMVLLIMTMARDFSAGLERVVKILFPFMLIIIVVLLGYALNLGDTYAALNYLFVPHIHQVSWHSVLAALGQAFFSLGLASGIILMYSAYLPDKVSIAKCAVVVAVIDTLIALIAGMVIFPIVFANNLAPSSGPGLIFKTLPLAFAKIPFGDVFAILFFLALLFAAFTSLVSLMEPALSWLSRCLNASRAKSAVIVGVVCWLLSILAIYSFATPKAFTVFGFNYYTIADYLSAQVIMPLGGLAEAVFAGWLLKKHLLTSELGWSQNTWSWHVYVVLIRYVIPVFIAVIFIASLFK